MLLKTRVFSVQHCILESSTVPVIEEMLNILHMNGGVSE